MAVESQWQTAQIQLPEVITDLTSVLDDLIGALIAILDIVLAVLDVVKAFLVGFIDPISAILAAILAEIEGLLEDIRQIGVYFSGDLDVEPPFNELLGGFTAYERRMIGRLIDKSDPTRPAFTPRSACVAVFTYYSFDTSTIQLALAFLDKIRKFFGLRGQTRTYTIPTGLNVSYGSTSTGLGAFGLISDILDTGEEPSVASLRWQMSPPVGAGAVSWPLPSPPGFLVEVSAVPDGLFLAYLTPPKDSQSADQVDMGLVSDTDGKPFKLHGGTYILQEDPSLTWEANGTTFTPPTGDRKTRFFAYRSTADNVPIPLGALQIDGKPVLQRTFFVDVNTILGINVAAPGQQYSALLNYEDMPYDATFESNSDGSVTVTLSDEPARDVYVRISAVTDVVASGTGDQASTFYWTISEGLVQTESFGQVRLGLGANARSDKSDPSAPLKVTFPSELTSTYLECVATAVAVLILSRADLIAQGISAADAQAAVQTAMDNVTNAPADATDQELSDLLDLVSEAEATATSANASFQVDTAALETGLEDLAQYIVPLALGNTSPARFFKKNFPDVTSFRGKLRQRCLAVANMLLAKTGPLPSSVLDLVISQAEVTLASGVVKVLSQVTWKDLDPDYDLDVTILDSLDPTTTEGSSSAIGVAANPVSAAKYDANFLGGRLGSTGPFAITLARSPGFMVPQAYLQLRPTDTTGENMFMDMGSADYSPVIYSANILVQMDFCRNVFHANPSIFTASQLVLNIAASATTLAKKQGGAWINYRLFPQGLPPVEAALNEIVAFLNAIDAGLKGILDAIVAYISYIEARILELEALLRRLTNLLDLILSIDVPAMSALIVTADGTDGILQALVAAENKPSDSSAAVSRITSDGDVVLGGTYGTGVVMLAGGLPNAVLDLLLLIFPPEE